MAQADGPELAAGITQHVEVSDRGAAFILGRGEQNNAVHLNFPSDTTRPGVATVAVPMRNLDQELRGRNLLLAQLRRLLDEPVVGKVLVLHGLGGCGKSRVALQLAIEVERQGSLVWWVSATDPGRISACMREVAGRLDTSTARITTAWSGDSSAPQLLWELLNSTDKPWLLVVDSADDPSIFDPEGRDVADGRGWLRPPRTSRGAVLVTSRHGNQDTWGSWTTLYPVAPLEANDAAQVLFDVAGQAGTAEDAVRLARRLGGLPLALNAAGAYLKSANSDPQWPNTPAIRTFADYEAALNERFENPFAVTSRSDLDDDLGLELAYQTVEVALLLMDRSHGPAARELLHVLSCLTDEVIPYAALLDYEILAESELFGGQVPRRLGALVHALADLSLVELNQLDNVANATYRHVLAIHPLVRAAARRHKGAQDQRERSLRLVTSLLRHAAAALDPDTPTSWPCWQLLAPHCIRALDSSVGLTWSDLAANKDLVVAVVELRLSASRYLDAVGMYRHAERMLDSLGPAAEILGAEHPTVLAVRHERTRALAWQGRFNDAETEGRALLDSRRQILGDEHPDTLSTWHIFVAILAYKHGVWREAERECRQVLEARSRALGNEHADTLVTWHNLGVAKAEQGQWAAAEEELLRVLEARIRVLGEGAPQTLLTMHELAATAGGQGRWAEAARKFAKVAKERTKLLGAEHPDTLVTIQELAGALGQLGRLSEAERRYRAVLTAQRRIFGNQHPDTLATRRNLGWLLGQQRRWAEAERECRAVLEPQRRMLGEVHPDTLTTRHNLAVAICHQGDAMQSEKELHAVLNIRTAVFGAGHPDTLVTRGERATALADQGLLNDAEAELRQVLEQQRVVLGPSHPDTLLTWHNLGWVLARRSDFAQAEAEIRQVLVERVRNLTYEHPYTATTMMNLAMIITAQADQPGEA